MSGEILADLLRGGLTTLEIAAGAWLLAALFGLVLALLRDLGMTGLRAFQASLVVALRSVPQLVVLYLIYFGLGQIGIAVNSKLAAILALGLTDAAFVAEYYRAGFMTVPATQREAGLSLGLSRLGVLWWVVIPQVVPFVVPPLLNAFVGLLKTATLAAAVGAPEVLYRAQNEMSRSGRITLMVAAVMLLYVGITLPLTRGIAVLERRVRRRARA
jgi:polar amino acid transport system permease protein